MELLFNLSRKNQRKTYREDNWGRICQNTLQHHKMVTNESAFKSKEFQVFIDFFSGNVKFHY